MVWEECLQPPNALLPKQAGQPSNQAIDTDALCPSSQFFLSVFSNCLPTQTETLTVLVGLIR